MIKVLVTGSTGFIGGHLVDKLLSKGLKVRCLVREESNIKNLKKKDVELSYADYSDINSLKKSLNGIDTVFHLGAILNGDDWEVLLNVNTKGTENLIKAYSELMQRQKRFVFISSIAASGPALGNKLKNEDEADTPVSLYGKSKLMAEEAVKEFSGKVNFVILRPPNVYGPNQKEMFTLIKVIRKRILPLLGGRKSFSTFSYVDDVVDAIVLAGDSPKALGKTYFISDNSIHSWRKTAIEIAKLLNVYPFVLPVSDRILFIIAWKLNILSKVFKFDLPFSPEDIKSIRKNNWIFDGSKLMKELNFRPKISLQEGLKLTIDYYKEHKLIK